MKILHPTTRTSKKVNSMSEIVKDMNLMMPMVKDLATQYGVLHHSQVSEKPFDFFVIAPILRPLFEGHWIICNAKITKFTNRKEILEHCSSYPHRQPKKVVRYSSISITCLVENPALLGELAEKSFELQGMPAFLVQHQMDHAMGTLPYKSKKK